MSQSVNMNEVIAKLRSVNYALNTVEVKGRNNLDVLLGSIQALDQVIAAINRSVAESEADQPEIQVEMVPEE